MINNEFTIVETYIRYKEFDKARARLRSIWEAYGNEDPRAWSLFGQINFLEKKYAKAIAFYEKAVELGDESAVQSIELITKLLNAKKAFRKRFLSVLVVVLGVLVALSFAITTMDKGFFALRDAVLKYTFGGTANVNTQTPTLTKVVTAVVVLPTSTQTPTPSPTFTMTRVPTNTATATATASLILTLTPTFTATQMPTMTLVPSLTQVFKTIVIVKEDDTLTIREGPGIGYKAITRLRLGDTPEVIAKSRDELWIKIRYGYNYVGWIAFAPSYITVVGNLADMPIAEK